MAEVQTQRDPVYYFSFRTFQVEDTLFRVPKHLFPIRNANLQPKPQGTDNGDDLVVLGPDIRKNDFLQLLRAVYPRHYNTPETLSSDEWQAVLALSETLGLDDVRQNAARNLKDIIFAGDPFEALLCAQKNHLDEWITPLIDIIVKTERNLSDEELAKVGMSMAIKIAWAQGKAGSPIQETSGSPSVNLPNKGKKKGKGRN